MAISQNFPNTRPSLNLNFARSKTLDPRITFSRTNPTATYVDDNGLIVAAGADEPRFDHDPITGESLGLLVEEQRSNTLPYSEDFSQSDWATFGTASKSSNVATAPDGNFTADSITIPTSSGVYDNIAASASTTYTFSSYIRGTPGSTVRILLNFNISGVTSKTVTVSDVWKRFDVTATSNASDSNVSVQYDQGNGNTFYVWGAQVEVGSFPTSYIPTSGSTATRSPDNVSMTGTNFSDWYNTTEGTVFLDCTPVYNNSTNQYRRLLSIHNNSGAQTDVIQFIQAEQSNNVSCAVWDGSSFQTGFSKTNTSGTRYKVAFAVKENNMNASYDGNIGTDATTCTLPAMTQMDIGKYTTGSGTQTTVHINNISYYPTRLSNTVLQTLTK